ncbi:serine/threonine-protein kinase [Nocardioides zeae]|uniref:non-specific serine/threonine protein kinase n=1 Tax=Nocardioides imazamoxiresistens TaxID=3231893 RepID=A0ABU3Q070_9ACTN|nr:serine/threonine-protein kinase [Nocardioides zeae]MDT9594902.1 serine/threonine-protein kinase [Nocardioides zeae]
MGYYPEPGDTFGPYTITDVVGRGGMGVVFAARQSGLDRTVALKVLSPQHAVDDDYRRRFVREAAALARLDSPHVIHVYDHGEVDGCLFLATQHVGGGDLGHLLRTHGALAPRAALAIAAQVADALHDAHRVGIVHRDVKPSNVLLRAGTSEPFSYLCDFGIAQAAGPEGVDGAEGADLTAAGAVAGTPAYLAPERCRGEAATPSSDLYAVGCVLVAMLTGHAPYRGSDVEVGVQHLHGPVPQLPGHDPLTARLNALLRRVLAKDPAQRHGSAAELRDELQEIRAGLTGAGTGTGPGTGAGSPAFAPLPPGAPVSSGAPRSRTLTWALAAAAVVVLVAGTAVGVVALRDGDGGGDDEASGSSPGTSATEAPSSPEESASADDDRTDDTDDTDGTGGRGSVAVPYGPATTATPADGALVALDGYSFRVPRGWTERTDVPNVDVAWMDGAGTGPFANNVNTVNETVPSGTTMNEVVVALGSAAQQLGGTDIELGGIVDLDGSPAVYQAATLQAGGGVAYRAHQFAALEGDRLLTITFSQAADTAPAASQEEIGSVLATFTWDG